MPGNQWGDYADFPKAIPACQGGGQAEGGGREQNACDLWNLGMNFHINQLLPIWEKIEAGSSQKRSTDI